MTRWVLVFCALVIGLVAPLECPAQTGTLQGYVYDADTTNPIHIAVVFFDEETLAFSDTNGYYTLELPSGDQEVLVYADGYQLVFESVIVPDGGILERSFYLVPAEDTRIYGTVMDCRTGDPVRDARLETDTGTYTYTDTSGGYSMVLSMGYYSISIQAPGYLEQTFDLFVDPMFDPEENFCVHSEADLGLIFGTVTNRQTSVEVRNAHLSLLNGSFSTVTDSDGFYFMELPPGEIDVLVEASGYVTRTVSVSLSAGELLYQDIELDPIGAGVDDHCNEADLCATTLQINGSPVQGSIETAGDVDWFRFQAIAGAEYEIETSDLGPGSDTYIFLYEDDGTTLIDSDDDDGVGFASKIVWICEQGGLFYIEVRHYASTGTGGYSVSIKGSDDHCNIPGECATELPANGSPQSGRIEVGGDEDWFRFSGVPGLTYKIETFDLEPGSDTVISLLRPDGSTLISENDDGGEGLASEIIWVADTQEVFYVRVRHFSQTGTGSYRIRLTGFDDHCDTPSSCATRLTPNGSFVQGSFEVDEDGDYFQFEAIPGVTYTIETGNLSPTCDTIVGLVSSEGEVIAANDDIDFLGGNYASRIIWTAEAAGTFYVLVMHWSETGRGTYSVSVTGSDDHANETMSWATWVHTTGEPMSGNIEIPGDTDLFRFSAESGKTYTIETGNLGSGCDTYIYLYDSEGFQLAYNDDIEYPTNIGSRITYTISLPGTYYVLVGHYDREAGTGTYEISIRMEDDHANSWERATLLETTGSQVRGEFEAAGDEDWFQFSAEAGQGYVFMTGNLTGRCDTVMELYTFDGEGVTLIDYDDDSGDGLASRIEWLAPSDGIFYVRIRHFSLSGTGGYEIWARTQMPDTDDYANTPAEAQEINPDGTPIPGQINYAEDVDWFQFEAQAGVAYVIETSCLDETCDTFVELYGTDGSTLIATDDDGGEGLGSVIRWSASASGTHYVAVQHFCAEGTGAYQIFIRQVDVACTSIQAGETVTGSLSGQGDGELYCLPVTGGTRMGVLLQGPAFGADFDLYMKWDGPPDLSSYDARGFSDTSHEQCEVTVTTAGTLYIWVRSYAGTGSYTLLVEENPYQPVCDFTLTEGVPHADSLDGPGDGKLYCLNVQEGDQVLITLKGPANGSDFDLYLKYGSPPTATDFDTRAYTAFQDETAALQNVPAGTLYVWVVSYSGSGEYVVEAQISPTQAGCVNLLDGVAQSGQLYFTYDEQLYCFEVEAGDQISVTLAGPVSGTDFDLFLKFGVPPALDDWDAASLSNSSNEQLQFTATSNGTVYITVWSYSGSGAYTIQASKISRQSLGLVTKLSQTPGQEVLFMKGSIKDRATGEPLQPSSFCITVKGVGKFCYQPGSGEASQISFIPGGYFFLVLPQAQNSLACVLSDVPCYQSVEKNFTMQQLSDAVFDISLDPGTDCDGDGMACGWEKRYGLNIWKNDASLDLDQDLYTNLEEYNAGTDPSDKNAFPTSAKSVVVGDINGDRRVSLTDAILVFQVAAGLNPAGIRVEADVNGDGKIGMAEALYVLQKVSGMR